MNCLEFRRRCLTEPGSQDNELLRHKRECPRCGDFVLSALQLEKHIGEAIRVSVPSNLTSRAILRQSLHADRSRQSRRRRIYACAASLLLVVGLASAWVMTSRLPPLDRAVLARINAVPASSVAEQQVSQQKLMRVLQTLGGELNGSLGQVAYASIYYVREHQCGQLVIAGVRGPVTVLLMPGVHVQYRRALQSRQHSGVIVPTANGSMAIVGDTGEPLDAVEQRVRDAVIWRL
ncbi:MAG: DUF3379 family protein [Acidiferrobacterales bacterium]